jgi:hypothetical protein
MRAPAVSVSTYLYARTLRWYPPALRDEFGDDMMEVFTESIEAAWKRASWGGVARAWLAVTRDVADIVVPYRVACVTPVLLGILCSIVFYGSMLAAIDPHRNCHK